MKHSESLIKFLPDFIKAQTEMEKATKSADNPFTKKKYADITAVIDASIPSLNKNNIAVVQPVCIDEQGNSVVETTLLHISGEWMLSETRIIVAAQNDPQKYGSGLTYARRYGLTSLLTMGQEDDDGVKATVAFKEEINNTQAELSQAQIENDRLQDIATATMLSQLTYFKETWPAVYWTKTVKEAARLKGVELSPSLTTTTPLNTELPKTEPVTQAKIASMNKTEETPAPLATTNETGQPLKSDGTVDYLAIVKTASLEELTSYKTAWPAKAWTAGVKIAAGNRADSLRAAQTAAPAAITEEDNIGDIP